MYQAIGEARDRREHPPLGRLIDVGGYRLHMVCVGDGAPPVVICPAIGGTVEGWQEVQRRVAEVTSVCVYDRNGLGRSDFKPRWPTARRMAEELHALLRAADVEPPHVLAGHSMGGLIVRVFTALYPEEVAGLALIDSSHPEQEERLPRIELADYPGSITAMVALWWARPLGMRRLARDLGLIDAPPVDRASHRRADAVELLGFAAVRRETSSLAGNLGDLPLAVLTSAELDPKDEPGSRPQRMRSRFYPGWLVLQNELAALSGNSTHVVADYGGHILNRDNPELVAQVLADLVGRIRSSP